MGASKDSKRSKYLPWAGGSAQKPNVAQDPPASPTSGRSGPNLRPEQSPGEQLPQQVALLQPTVGRSSRFMHKLKSGFRSPSRSPSPSLGAGHRIETPVSQSLAISAGVLARPHSSNSEISALQTHGPSLYDLPALTPGGHVAAVLSGGSHSSSVSLSKPIASGNPVPSSTSAPHPPTSTSQVQSPATANVHTAVLPETKSTLVSEIIEPSPPSAMVWTKALEIAKKKLRDNNLPPLNLTNLTSLSTEENIEAVVKALNTLQQGGKKWSYTWRGKEVIIVEHWGKILKIAEKYSRVANTPVSTLVWTGVLAILQVRIQSTGSTH